MLKSKVNTYLNKNVEVRLFDYSVYIGNLTSTNEYKGLKANYYFVKGVHDRFKFRSSHIKSIKLVDNTKELDENKLFRKEGGYLSGCAYCPPGEPGKPGDWQGEENDDK